MYARSRFDPSENSRDACFTNILRQLPVTSLNSRFQLVCVEEYTNLHRVNFPGIPKPSRMLSLIDPARFQYSVPPTDFYLLDMTSRGLSSKSKRMFT